MNVAGVEGDRLDVREAPRALEGEHDLRELGLAVGAPLVVAALEHEVLEVQALLAGRGGVHDPPRRIALEQPRCDQERRQVVDLERQLDPVAGHDPLLGDQARVVDEHVDARQRLRERPHVVEHAEVRQVHARRADLARHRVSPLRGTPVHEHVQPALREVVGDDAAEAVGGAGDEDGGHGQSRSWRTRFGSDSTTRS